MLAVVQSSALQVETLATSLAIRGLPEQIKPEDQCEETADTQQVDSDDDMDKDERRTNIRRLSPLKWEPDQSSSTLQQRKRRLQVPSAMIPSRSMTRTSLQFWQHRWATTRQSDHVLKESSRQQSYSTSSGIVAGQ